MSASAAHPHLPLVVGTPVLIEIVHLEEKFKSSLVGVGGQEYLIVKLSHNDLVGTFRSSRVTESPLIIRYMYGGTIYGFESRIINSVTSPERLLFVEYPEKIEEFNARTNPRYECILPAATVSGDASFDTVVVDISRTGCRCAVKTPTGEKGPNPALSVNTEVELRIKLPGVSDELSLKGSVKNVNREEERITFGIFFEELSPGAKKSLEEFLSLIETI